MEDGESCVQVNDAFQSFRVSSIRAEDIIFKTCGLKDESAADCG